MTRVSIIVRVILNLLGIIMGLFLFSKLNLLGIVARRLVMRTNYTVNHLYFVILETHIEISSAVAGFQENICRCNYIL